MEFRNFGAIQPEELDYGQTSMRWTQLVLSDRSKEGYTWRIKAIELHNPLESGPRLKQVDLAFHIYFFISEITVQLFSMIFQILPLSPSYFDILLLAPTFPPYLLVSTPSRVSRCLRRGGGRPKMSQGNTELRRLCQTSLRQFIPARARMTLATVSQAPQGYAAAAVVCPRLHVLAATGSAILPVTS